MGDYADDGYFRGDYGHGLCTSPPYKVGDIVRVRCGSSPIRITKIYKDLDKSLWYVDGYYLSTKNVVRQKRTNDLTTYSGSLQGYDLSIPESHPDTDQTQTKKDDNMLYQFNVDDKIVFGAYLATNSDGKWVMEARDTKAIHLLDKKDVEEVLPYTISVRFSNSDGSQTYSYFAEKDKFTLGFYLVNGAVKSGFGIAEVVALDTKSKSATKDFTPIGKLNVDMY